jgi:hypothetical protein
MLVRCWWWRTSGSAPAVWIPYRIRGSRRCHSHCGPERRDWLPRRAAPASALCNRSSALACQHQRRHLPRAARAAWRSSTPRLAQRPPALTWRWIARTVSPFHRAPYRVELQRRGIDNSKDLLRTVSQARRSMLTATLSRGKRPMERIPMATAPRAGRRSAGRCLSRIAERSFAR